MLYLSSVSPAIATEITLKKKRTSVKAESEGPPNRGRGSGFSHELADGRAARASAASAEGREGCASRSRRSIIGFTDAFSEELKS